MTSPHRLGNRLSKSLAAVKDRLLDGSRRVDYAIAFLIGVTPIGLAPIVGVESSLPFEGDVYDGYHHRVNWMSFCVTLPAVLWAFRWITSRIGGRGESSTSSSGNCPPVVKLMQGYKSRPKKKDDADAVVAKLKKVFDDRVFGTGGFAFAAVASLLISIVDVGTVGLAYHCAWRRSDWDAAAIEAACGIAEKGWSTMFLTGKVGDVGFHENLLFVFVAYLVQACVILVGLWMLVIMFRHNSFFVNRIYRKSRDEAGADEGRHERFRFFIKRIVCRGDEAGAEWPRDEDERIVIDLKDPERCFGFRPAFRAFNTQVITLLAGGLVMLVSRYLNVDAEHATAIETAVGTLMEAPGNVGVIATLWQADNVNLAPADVGQWMLIAGWLAALTVVSMPGWVKYVPLWTLLRRRKAWMITEYLKELLPNEDLEKLGWKVFDGTEPDLPRVNRVAASFSTHSFWPTGDERAKFLFFWAFFVLLVLLFPLVFDPDRIPLQIAYWVFVTLLALLVAKVFFVLLRRPIFYVDPRLVASPADAGDGDAGAERE